MTTPTRESTGLFNFLGIMFVVLAGAFMWASASRPTPEPTVAPIDAAEITASDLQMVVAFHVAVVGFTKRLETRSASFVTTWERQSRRLDFFALYETAQDYRDAMSALRKDAGDKTGLPPVRSEIVREKLPSARGGLLKAIDTQIEVAELLMAIADSRDLRPSTLAKLKDLRTQTAAFLLIGGLAFVDVFQALGVSIDQIDTKNGGVLGENELSSTPL